MDSSLSLPSWTEKQGHIQQDDCDDWIAGVDNTNNNSNTNHSSENEVQDFKDNREIEDQRVFIPRVDTQENNELPEEEVNPTTTEEQEEPED